MIDHQPDPSTEQRVDTADRGFSLVELLVIIVILGILATIVAFGVRGIRAEAADSTCNADERILWTAAESYFNQNETDTIPATGIDDDRYGVFVMFDEVSFPGGETVRLQSIVDDGLRSLNS